MLLGGLQFVIDGLHLLQLHSVRGDGRFEQAAVELPPDVGEADVIQGPDFGLVGQYSRDVDILQVEQRSVKACLKQLHRRVSTHQICRPWKLGFQIFKEMKCI